MNYNNDLYSRNRSSKFSRLSFSSGSGSSKSNYSFNNNKYNSKNNNNTNSYNSSSSNNNNNNYNSNNNNNNNNNRQFINKIKLPLFINNNKYIIIVKKYYKRFQQSKYKKLLFVIQVLVLFLLLQHTLNKFQRTDDSDSTLIRYRNNLCSSNSGRVVYDGFQDVFPNEVIGSGGSNILNGKFDKSILCNEYLNKDQLKYKKFIWIFVDSLAHDQAYDIIEPFKESSDVYRVLTHGFKFSTAIYTTFFTGKIPTNYAGKPIRSDNIFYQFKKSGFKIHFVGPEFPAPALLADSPSIRKYFDQFTIIPDEHQLFTQLFSAQATEDTVYDRLQSLSSNGQKSVMLTTNLLDDRIHRNGKNHPPTLKLLLNFKENIPLIKKWLAENPDYLLILNSDHGGSKTGGQHEGELHGAKDGGNEGFFLFFNHNLKSHSSNNDKPWLDTVDLAPTITRYFKDVNIPLESLGLVSTSHYDDSVANKTSIYIDLLNNAIQIRELCKLKNFPYKENDFEKATSYGTSISNITPQQLSIKIEELKKFIISIKEPMVEFKKFPTNYLFIIGILILIIQVVNLNIEIQQSDLLLMLKNNFLPTVLPYFYIYVDFLFLKFDYHKHFTNTFTFYLIIIPIIILYLIYNLNLEKYNNDINSLLYNNGEDINNEYNNNNNSNSSSSNNNNNLLLDEFSEIDISIQNQQPQQNASQQSSQVPLQQQIPPQQQQLGSQVNQDNGLDNDIHPQQQQDQDSNNQDSLVQQQQDQISSPTSQQQPVMIPMQTMNYDDLVKIKQLEQYQNEHQKDIQKSQEQIQLEQQQFIEQQLQYQSQFNQPQIIINNIELDWLQSLFYNVCFVMFTFISGNFIIEFLPMIYEMFQSWIFIINYIVLYYLLYLLVLSKTQLLQSNGNCSNGSGSGGFSIYNLIISNNPINILNSSQSKMVFLKSGGVYFTIVTLFFLYDFTGHTMPSVMQFAYFIMIIQVLLLIGIGGFVDDSYLISNLLLFALGTENQRFYLLVFFGPQLYLLSNSYCSSINSWRLGLQTSSFNGKLKSLSRMIVLFMVVLSIKSYMFMGGQFNMNVDVRAGNIGLLNMEDYPTVSGFLMVFHKLGYFFILITFLVRLSKSYSQDILSSSSSSLNINSSGNNNNNSNNISISNNNNNNIYNNSSSNNNNNNNNNIIINNNNNSIPESMELKNWIFRILAQKSIVLMWIFNLNFWLYKDYLDCFISTLIISIITVGFGVCLLLDELSKYLKKTQLITKYINRQSSY